MSGIAGGVRLDGASVASGDIEGMLARMVTRGPDRQRAWSADNAGLGQVLLVTTREALADIQPWRHAESGCVVVSDSRLDNRPELLHALGIPEHADDVGDGPLLHAAWQRWGRDCASHLLGDFAFAIWDARNQRLFCARDHMGIRPFYYHHAEGEIFAFASDARALLGLRGVPSQLNEPRIADILSGDLEGFDKTSSMFDAISRLPPAHTLELDGRFPSLREYWTPVDRPPFAGPVSEQVWIDGLEGLVVEAVQCRLRGNRPIGSMLSGGLDSSAVVSIASASLARDGLGPLPTFSAISSVPNCPETRAVMTMRTSFPVEATLIDPDQVPDTLTRIAASIGNVGEQFDAWMTMIDCQYLAAHDQGVRVVLDGIDADSLLAHGDHLSRLVSRGRLLQAWHESRELARFYNEPYSFNAWLRPALLRGLVPPRLRTWLQQWRPAPAMKESLLSASAAERLAMAARKREHKSRLANERASKTPAGAMTSSGSPYLIAGIERYGRVASRRGIEPRHPFLDRRLVEYCAWLPASLRVRDGYPKWALRQAMSSHLPRDVAWRRGKEHLGWRFNLGVLNQLPLIAGTALAQGHGLAGLLDVHRIPQPASGHRWQASDPRWEDALMASSLKAWVDTNASDPDRGEPAGPDFASPESTILA